MSDLAVKPWDLRGFPATVPLHIVITDHTFQGFSYNCAILNRPPENGDCRFEAFRDVSITSPVFRLMVAQPGSRRATFFCGNKGSSATLGTTTSFQGNILALTSITLNTGAKIGCGSALALNGAVTLDTNVIGGGCGSTSTVPEPGTLGLLGTGLVVLGGAVRRKLRL